MQRTVTRRTFLRSLALATAAAGTGFLQAGPTAVFENDSEDRPARAQDEKKTTMMPIVDTHQHLWDLTKFRLPWIKEGSPLARSFLMPDYVSATAGLPIIKAVYMEVDVDPDQQTREAQYVLRHLPTG